MLRCNELHWFGHVKQSGLYTGQILDLEVGGSRRHGFPKKYWLDAIKLNLQAETCQNHSEWKKRLKTASHTHAGCVT